MTERPFGNAPSVEGPEVDLLSDRLSNPVEPGDPGMGGLGYLPLHIEVEVALGRRSPPLCDAELVGRARAEIAFSELFHSGVILVRGPVLHKVLKEGIPRRQLVATEVGKRG